jgi:uncharacterized protein (DUF427 family)
MPVDEPWNIPIPPARVEPSPRWIRVRVGDTVLADSRSALLLTWYGPGMLPTYALPAEDVRTDLLRPSSDPGDGVGGLVDHDVVVDGVEVPGAARRFGEPPNNRLRAVADHWTFTWEKGVHWFEEAFEVHHHARDTTKRVDVVPSDRRVRVELEGELVAESDRTHALFESWLPPRWYFPPDDVRDEVFVPSDMTSDCPYKGHATYWSVRAGGVDHPDVAWRYADPVVECPRIAGLISFFNERVDLVIDGELQERPRTPWS